MINKDLYKYALIIPGWFRPNEMQMLASTADSLPEGSTIVEIGSYKGRSTVGTLSAIKGTNKRIFSVDTFCDPDDPTAPNTFIEFVNNITPVQASNLFIVAQEQILASKTLAGIEIDLLFIDGPHSYEGVKASFENFKVLLKPNAYVYFHDYCKRWPGVMKFVDEIVYNGIVEKIDQADTLFCSRLLLKEFKC